MGKKFKENGKPQKIKNLKKIGITSKNEKRRFNDNTIIKPAKVDAKKKILESESKKKEQKSTKNNTSKSIVTKSNEASPKKIVTPNKLSPLQMKMKEQLESSRFVYSSY